MSVHLLHLFSGYSKLLGCDTLDKTMNANVEDMMAAWS